MNRNALAMLLSDKFVNDRVVVIDRFDVPEGKTKQLRAILNRMPSKGHRVLLSLGQNDQNVIRAARNIPKTSFCAADSLNVLDLLDHEYLLLDKEAVKKIEDRFEQE